MATDEIGQARQMEEAGDAAVAEGEPARSLYAKAQALLMPVGRMWGDREEYDQRMEAFTRVQQKLYALPLEYKPVPTPQPKPASQTSTASVAPWRALAAERRFVEAAELLRPTADSYSGMGAYAAEGYSAESVADDAAKNGDAAWARSMYEHAMRSYLMYALFPGRGDSEDYGLGLAEEVLKKLERLE